MKTRSLLFAGVLPFLAIPAAAQLPDVSTPDAPKWYYIRVLGDASRADLVFTANDANRVVGKAQSASTDIEEISRQLWRFEKNADGRYQIINWKTGLSVDVVYDSAEKTGLLTLTDNPSVSFAINSLNAYYQIESSSAAVGSPASEVYCHQGNGGYSWSVILTGTTYGAGVNSSFSFIPFKDFRYKLSDGDNQTYYTLENASAAYAGRVVTAGAEGLTLAEAGDVIDPAAQWRVEASATGVKWINRATEQELGTEAMPYGLFNLLQPVTFDGEKAGWTLAHIGQGQYTFTSVGEDDGITRYMGADADNAEEAQVPNPEKLVGSTFAWTLNEVETIATGIGNSLDGRTAIRVENGRIVVTGTDDWAVYGLDGVQQSRSAKLVPGIYVVKAGDTVTKVVVK